MKTIIKIFLNDLKKIKSNAIAIIVIVGISVIPALYAWFNIAASWDPYGSTDGIKVAVVNLDKGTNVEGISLKAGSQVIGKLKENKQIGWTFLDDKTKAIDGVKSGDYYAAIIMPNNFSENMTSLLASNEIELPSFDYYINEKKNAIAPKITDKGVEAIQQQINESFIAVIVETAGEYMNDLEGVLSADGSKPLDRFINSIKVVSKDLNGLETTIDAFVNTINAVDELVKTTKLALPDLNAFIKEGNQATTNIQDLMLASKSSVLEVNKTLSDTMSALIPLANNLNAFLADAEKIVATDSEVAAKKLDSIADGAQDIVDINNGIISVLNGLQQGLGENNTKLQKTITILKEVNVLEVKIMNDANHLAARIRKDGKLAQDVLTNLKNNINNGISNVNQIKNDFNTNVKPELDTLLSDMFNTLTQFSGMLDNAATGISKIDSILDGVNTTLQYGNQALLSTKTSISSLNEKVNTIIKELESANADEQVSKLLEILKTDPELMGSFMSSPVTINTHSLYPIENYGSAMTPFYSTLAIWVGGIVLVAILKTQIKEDDEIKNIKPYQAYFGRLLLFALIAFIQASIICLGDLYFLQIQCLHPFLFMVAGWACSFVFTSIIYTLTISFGDIGKALCVILLVIQVAGSGGTFPIEVTPAFFQGVYPFLPFVYGIKAMRECIAGMYDLYFLFDILRLFLFLPFVLLLGLVLRKPLMRLNHFFEKRLEDTGFM